MSPTIGLPPPDPESCLVTSRVSSQRGGTLINEAVRDLDAHARRICNPDGYRPSSCPRCGNATLHVHCYPERRPRGDSAVPPVIRVIQYICASSTCGATWRVLPLFLARHLWRTWATVERAVKPEDTRPPPDAPPIPAQTERRWRARLAASARLLVVLLAASGGLELEELARSVDFDATRAELVDGHAIQSGISPNARLAALAAIVHRLERGIRLM